MRVGGIAGLLIASLALSSCVQETGTNSTGSIAPKSAPGALRYTENPVAYVIGQAATPNVLSSSGTPDRVTITPSLPAGLTFDVTTGKIGGTPTTATAAKDYDVRAINAYGSAYLKLRLSVGDTAPALTLSTANLSGVVGSALIPLVATNAGGAIVSCSTSPLLPNGVTVVASSGGCTISGTPSAVFSSSVVTLTASSSARSTNAPFTLSIIDLPPSFSFSGPLSYPRNVAGYVASPTSTGGKITACTINPALPSGITLRSDCSLSGSPSTLAPATFYVLTGSNSGGTATANLQLAVVDQTPVFHYTIANAALTLVKGTAMTTAIPVVTAGAIESCSASPPLPTGLSLSSGCTLSGTPTSVQAETTHVISATNSAGSGSTPIKITVNDVAPRFSYIGALLIVNNRSSANFQALHNGGTAISCSAAPSLPAGLVISTNCSITGSPTQSAPVTEYSITAKNSGGSFTRIVQISVPEVAPSISYSPSQLKATLGTAVSDFPIQNSGGAITSCTIEPALPGSLSLNSACGISGMPIVLSSPATTYTVTAQNLVGSSQTLISVEVVDRQPELRYPGPSRTLTLNEPLTTWIPISTGGAITNCSDSPKLPSGLVLSTTDCSISGTPSSLSSQQTYTISATNTGGTASTTITLTVTDRAPAIQFMPGSVRFTLLQAATPVNSLNSSGDATSCNASPALPTGIGVSTSNGSCLISGTPTALSTKSGYTITATNTGGTSSALLEIEVVDTLPIINYAPLSQTLTRGIELTSWTPLTSGGAIIGCTTSQPLPSGLAISSDCVISGIPSTLETARSWAVTATNSGGSGTASISITINDQAPSGLTYFDGAPVYTTGVRITENTPSSSGGAVLSYSITPALPAGLSFNTTNGVIAGTPTATQSPAAVHTITASNSGGSTTGTISLTVNAPAPTISYLGTPFTFVKGVAVSSVTATSSNAYAFGISGTLPAGLNFNASTGEITGTPTELLVATPYSVTVTNSTGQSASITINLKVIDLAPSSLSYSAPSATYTLSTAITDNTPTISGGTVLSYSISPGLPAGLSLNSATGVISGTPTATQSPAAVHTVTALNSGGSANATLTLTVNAPAPTLAYSGAPFTFTKGAPVSNITATSQNAVAFAISGRLPNGLLLSSSTGDITGTPTELMAATPFIVTATNSTAQSATATITVAVNDVAPSGLTYFDGAPVYTTGVRITENTPSSSGGAVLSYSITPALPAGLSFNTTNGVIAGTPTATQSPAAVHTITASNSGGSTTGTISLTVNAPTPALSYTGSPFAITKNSTVTITPVASNSTSFSLTGSLPNGLSFDSSSGVISGVSTTLSPSTVFTISASNSTGQLAYTTISLAVVDTIPSLTYNGGPYYFTKDQPISALIPTNSGGTTTSCSSSPELPTGLSLSSGCVISGSPTILSGSIAYAIQAANSGGTSTVFVTISVISATPEVPSIFLNWISLSAANGAWNGTPNSEARIWKARIDGASRTLHSTLTLGWSSKDFVQAPRLAPNASYWVAVSSRNLSGDPADPDSPCSNLWKVSPDGSQWTALTTNTITGADSLDPAISPDSSVIAFSSKQPVLGSNDAYNLWTMNSSGGSQIARTEETVAGRDSRDPSFSPSGGTIIFASRRAINTSASGSYNLWKYNISTGSLSYFSGDTPSGFDRRHPRYSNDGGTIVYISTRPLAGGSSTNSFNIWTSTASTLSETAITATTGSGQDVAAPEFSVNDRYIAFQGYRPINGVTPLSSNIWIYDSVTATFTPITQNTSSGLDSQLMPGSSW